MARSPRIPSAPVRFIWRRPSIHDDALLAEVRQYVERGFIVRVACWGTDRFEVVRNDTRFLVRSPYGRALATVDNVAAAILAGERHLAGPSGSFDPQGGTA